jgi:UDPglucose 6-dehydrogenase
MEVDYVTIIGSGVVGYATGRALQSHGHHVQYVDASETRRDFLQSEGINCLDQIELDGVSRIILICVPTPSTGNTHDLGYVEAALNDVGVAIKGSSAVHVVAIRSTVPPLTAEELAVQILEDTSDKICGEGFHIGSAPEFLRQASALEDSLNPWMTVVAAPNADVRQRLTNLFGVLGGDHRSFDRPAVAEAIKIMHNCFNAAKISFFNEMHLISEAIGIDSRVVAETIVRSAEASHNIDYGTRTGYAFGGACLPKDIDGLIGFAEANDVTTPMLNAIRQVNNSQRLKPSVG